VNKKIYLRKVKKVNIMKELKNAVIVDGVAYTINATEAKKIAQLLGLGKVAQTTTTTNTTKSTTTPKKSTRIVGSLECDGKFVRTVKGAFLSSKARYAIKMSATEDFGATKLSKGNKVYDALAKEDKYVQIYEFKTAENATKFMDNQQNRMAK
jgi:spore germination protein YaaH